MHVAMVNINPTILQIGRCLCMFLGGKVSQKAAADRAAEYMCVTGLRGNKHQRGKKGRISPKECRIISSILPICPHFCTTGIVYVASCSQ